MGAPQQRPVRGLGVSHSHTCPGCSPGGMWQPWLPVQGDLWASLPRAGLGASRDLGGLSLPNLVPNSGQKGKVQGAPGRWGLGGTQLAGGQEQEGGPGSPAWPVPRESPGSPQGTPGNGLRGLGGCARLLRGPPGGPAKNSRGMAGQGQPVGGRGEGPRGASMAAWAQDRRQWCWRTHPVPGGRPAGQPAAQLTGYFFPA